MKKAKREECFRALSGVAGNATISAKAIEDDHKFPWQNEEETIELLEKAHTRLGEVIAEMKGTKR